MTSDELKTFIRELASSVDFDRCVGVDESDALTQEVEDACATVDALTSSAPN